MAKLASSVPAHRLVRRNALWNVLGIGLPGLVAVFFIPLLIKGMGTDRFGVLTLILAFLSYFGLFDLGVGRALTQILAGGDGEDKRKESALVWTVSALLFAMGVLGGVAFYFAAPYIADKLFHVKGALAPETVTALRALSLALPFLLHSLALKGILEAKRRFDLSNIVRVPMVAFTFIAPILTLPFSHDLRVIVPVILLGRLLGWILNLGMVLYLLPHLRAPGWMPDRVGGLFRMGGWFTVSGVIGPLIDAMDRFLISALLSISAVAYYTTPYELILRLGIIYGGIGGVVFPEFAMRYRNSPEEARRLFMRSIKYLLAIMFPILLVATAYAHEGLSLWLDPAFADRSAPVLRWLAVFVLGIAVTLTPYMFLGGVGRPDLSARMHLIELPIHACLLVVLIKLDGIRGAAIANTLRIFIDFAGMLYFSGGLLAFDRKSYARVVAPVAGAVAVLLVFHIPMDSTAKAILTAVVLSGFAIAAWRLILEAPDKQAALRVLQGMTGRGKRGRHA